MLTSWWQLLRALCWGFQGLWHVPTSTMRPTEGTVPAYTLCHPQYNKATETRLWILHQAWHFLVMWNLGKLTSLQLMSNGGTYVCPPWVGEDQARGSSTIDSLRSPLKGRDEWRSFLHKTFECFYFLISSMNCHRLSCVPTQFIHWSPNLQYLKMWMYLETGPLKWD